HTGPARHLVRGHAVCPTALGAKARPRVLLPGNEGTDKPPASEVETSTAARGGQPSIGGTPPSASIPSGVTSRRRRGLDFARLREPAPVAASQHGYRRREPQHPRGPPVLPGQLPVRWCGADN